MPNIDPIYYEDDYMFDNSDERQKAKRKEKRKRREQGKEKTLRRKAERLSKYGE